MLGMNVGASFTFKGFSINRYSIYPAAGGSDGSQHSGRENQPDPSNQWGHRGQQNLNSDLYQTETWECNVPLRGDTAPIYFKQDICNLLINGTKPVAILSGYNIPPLDRYRLWVILVWLYKGANFAPL